jgi:hypothetical protein
MRQSRFSGKLLGMTSNSNPSFFKISTRRGDCDAKTTRRPANFESTSSSIAQRRKGLSQLSTSPMIPRPFERVASLRDLHDKQGRLQVRLKSGRGVLLLSHNGSIHALDHACYRVFCVGFVTAPLLS